VVLMVGDAPNKQFVQLWNELIRAYASDARYHFALGPADAHWPKDVKHLSIDVNGVLVRLSEVDVPPLAPATSEVPLHPETARTIHDKLDRLLEGHERLLESQGAIYRSLETSQRETVTQVLAGLRHARLDEAEVRQELRNTLDAIRRALIHLQTQQLPDLSTDLKQMLDEVTEMVSADVDLRTGLELTIPLIPLLLNYKTTLDAGAGLDLRQAWEDLINWAR
jgi:hypothetical protein